MLLLLLLAPACTGGSGSGGSSSSGTGQEVQGETVVPRLQHLGLAVVDADLLDLAPAERVDDRQIQEILKGPGGGQITLSGDLQIGGSAPGVQSTLKALFQGYTFHDGVSLSGGSGTLTTTLYGTTEADASGTQVLQGTGVTFARGTSSEVHDFKASMTVVNGKIVDAQVTVDNGAPVVLGFVLQLANKSQNPDDQVYVTIVGKSQQQTAWFYMPDADALALTEFDDAPGKFLSRDPNGAFQGADKYSMRLSDMTPLGNHTYRLLVPRENLVSGRIFFSFGRKLQGIGIAAPFYSPGGHPVTQAATATVQSVNANQVTLTGVDATQALYVGEPVSYSGSSPGTTVARIVSSTVVELSQVSGIAGSTVLTFTPDASQFAAAKLNLSLPSVTGQPDYRTTFEFMELSATTDPTVAAPYYTLYANTSAIDFFSIGLGMAVNFSGVPGGTTSQKVVGFGTSATDILNGVSVRDAVFGRFNNTSSPTPATPSEFQAFVTAQPAPAPSPGVDPYMSFGGPVDSSRQIIRVLGPPQTITSEPNAPSGACASYLSSAIAADWSTFLASVAANGITIDFPSSANPSFTFVGQAGGPVPTTLNLKCTFAAGSNTGLNESYQLPAPTGFIVFQCDDTRNPGPLPDNYMNAGSDAHKRLVSLIAAAFTRGVFANFADWSDKSKFYTRSDLKYNFFSKVMHDFALDGIIYGFAYDDVFGQDSTIAGPIGTTSKGNVPPTGEGNTGNVTDLTIVIPNFLAPPPPALPGAPLTVQAEIPANGACNDPNDTNLQGFVVHFSPNTGADVVGTLDATGKAVVSGLQANTPYTVWIAPTRSAFVLSYAAYGMYDGTTGGTWSSSTGTNTAGLIRLQIGQLKPGVGPCLSPAPNNPGPKGFPAPTANSGQATWGNLTPP